MKNIRIIIISIMLFVGLVAGNPLQRGIDGCPIESPQCCPLEHPCPPIRPSVY